MKKDKQYIRWFEDLNSDHVPIVGGKNASLGEMISKMKKHGIRVPEGFATTAEAYREFVRSNELEDKIRSQMDKLNSGQLPLEKVGNAIRGFFLASAFPEIISESIRNGYRQLSKRYKTEEVDVAVRSSATAEDLLEASFAGQQESYLNISGEEQLLDACRKCYASLFTDRAITYRENQGFDHMDIALSIGVQKMVRSDKASAGVMFSIDTETGFPNVVVIDAAWGLGENIVQGIITPDHYIVFKPALNNKKMSPIIEKEKGAKQKKMVYSDGGGKSTVNIRTTKKEQESYVLSDEEIIHLGRWATLIEKHYKKPMDIEWAKDGDTDQLFIVQARPETVQSRKEADVLKTYELKQKGEVLVKGLAIGDAIASGEAQIIKSADEIGKFKEGAILVTEMTDPDWVPIMKKSSGIVTDHGGRTSHAAIVSRELGVSAIVGTGNATEILKDDDEITISCAEGDEGYVYKGILKYDEKEINTEEIPSTKTQIMMNIASPAAAFRWWRLPVKGIGLARMEFIINNIIKIHPLALIHYKELKDSKGRKEISRLTNGYENKTEYFVENLSRGIAKIAASQYPEQVIVRMSDFKSNEYANLICGSEFEPIEENPMLGFRGASRYYSKNYREGFNLECEAIKRVRNEIGLTNVVVMIPFCRTTEEADKVLSVLEENGLKRGKKGLEIYVMIEIPSNVILAEKFSERFDGFSIGSNDLTQLVLGVDRDSEMLSGLFNEQNEAVKVFIQDLIKRANKTGTKVGICGQAPSDHPEFAQFLVRSGINSISVNPDSAISVIKHVAEAEKK